MVAEILFYIPSQPCTLCALCPAQGSLSRGLTTQFLQITSFNPPITLPLPGTITHPQQQSNNIYKKVDTKTFYHYSTPPSPLNNLHAANGKACNFIPFGLIYPQKVTTPIITQRIFMI